MDDEWQFPAPMEDPEARKVRPGEKGGGFPGIIPEGNFVEGDMEEDARKDGPSCPFPHG